MVNAHASDWTVLALCPDCTFQPHAPMTDDYAFASRFDWYALRCPASTCNAIFSSNDPLDASSRYRDHFLTAHLAQDFGIVLLPKPDQEDP